MFLPKENLMENFQSIKQCNSIFEKVPYELRAKITDDLYLEDLLRLRLVCQSWYRVFCSTNICIHAIKKYFPLSIDYYYEKSGLNCTELEESRKKEDWLQRFIKNRIRREHGIASRSFDLDQNLWEGDFKFRYTNGRVVFHSMHGFTIEDLITRQQYNLVNPRHAILMPNWQLSDSYLLVPFTNSSSLPFERELVAWDLVSKQMHSIPLFERVKSLSGYKNRVGIVTISSTDTINLIKSYIWHVGGVLTRLQQTKQRINASGDQIVTTDIFFPILEKDVVFFVYQTRLASSLMTEKYGTRVTVQCFEAGVLTQTQHEVIYTLTKPEDYRSTKITNDGIICFEVLENPKSRISMDFYTHVTYDMSRKLFNRIEFHLHASFGRNLLDHKNLIWRDQIYNPSLDRIFGEMRELHVVTISKSLIDIWTGPLQSDRNSSLSFMKSSILFSETREHCSCTEVGALNIDALAWSRRVWGDDSFLILNLEGNLKVWQFDDLGLEPTRQTLNDLPQHLETSEIFYIRSLLNDIQVSLPGNQLFRKLPTQVYLNILDDLDLEDLLRLRLVCPSWYSIFCSVDVSTHAVKKHFPLPIDYYYKKSSLDCTEIVESRNKEDWLQRFIINRIRRERGISSKSFVLNENNDSRIDSLNLCYSNGRIATLNPDGFTVEDLITRQKSIFPVTQYLTYLNWQLSDRYLIIPYDHISEVELVAWNLVSRRKFSTPIFDQVFSISAYQDQIGIITSLAHNKPDSFKSYIWDLENAIKLLVEVEIKPDIAKEEILAANIFFHILDK
ncbi:hypothetical protein EPUL_003695, partial [Erysiphe pulchra]